MVFSYLFLYAPLAFLLVSILIYFQDIGFKLIFLAVAVWFTGFWLIPELMEKARDLVFVLPPETDVSVRGAFAIMEAILAAILFLVGKYRNWIA